MSSCEFDLTNEPNKVQTIQHIISSAGTRPVYVLFYSDGCGACVEFKPYFISHAKQCRSKQAVIIQVSSATGADVHNYYGIRAIPTLIVFRNGQEVERIVGGDVARMKAVMQFS